MKFKIGAPPCDFKDDIEQDKWKQLKMPNTIVFKILLILIGLSLNFILYQFIKADFSLRDLSSASALIVIAYTVPIHEFIHMIFLPELGLSNKTTIGFNPKCVVFYVNYNGILNINRFLVVLIMPFLIISVLSILIMCVFDFTSPYLTKMVLFNTFAGSADLLYFILTVIQVPEKARVINTNIDLYWSTNKID